MLNLHWIFSGEKLFFWWLNCSRATRERTIENNIKSKSKKLWNELHKLMKLKTLEEWLKYERKVKCKAQKETSNDLRNSFT